MNNRYIFRGKRKDNGAWVEGYYACQSNHSCIPSALKYQHFIFKDVFMDFNLGGLGEYEVIPGTVGQCTGLKDKNSKMIFEGDILKFVSDDREISLYVVIWDTSLLSWQVQEISHYVKNDYYGFDELCEFGDTELIGNIHDNLELLEAER